MSTFIRREFNRGEDGDWRILTDKLLDPGG
jgi:hypothetical protein